MMKTLWDLYRSFFQIGIVTFGGGYAMLPMLQRVIVEQKGWATEEELLNYFAVGQCTPGVIAVNTATFIGYKKQGVPGAIAATLGVVSPSLLIIVLIAMVLEQAMKHPAVSNAFRGIRVAVCALIASSVFGMMKKAVKDKLGIVLCILAFVIVALLGASPLYVVLGAAITGIAAGKVREKK